MQQSQVIDRGDPFLKFESCHLMVTSDRQHFLESID